MFSITKHRHIFLLMSLSLLLADAALVIISHHNAHRQLKQHLTQEGQQLQQTYQVALEQTLTSMSQLALFIANDPRIRHIFGQAAKAVILDQGRLDGPETTQLRQELYTIVAPSWQAMTHRYIVRQLHFHLAPGATSFLRVHKPERFGDNMDHLRHMVVDVNRDQQSRTGLELGRVYAGLRGVVPLYDDSTPPQHLGALEVGTAFEHLIHKLSQAMGADIAILMDLDRANSATWQPTEKVLTACHCTVEATSSPELTDVLAALGVLPPSTLQAKTHLLDQDGLQLAITQFGIQDYIGQRDQHAQPVAQVLIWRNISPALQQLQQDLISSLLLAVIGFLSIEILLFYSLRMILGHLEQEVDRKTHAIRQLNSQLNLLSYQDALTQVHNRRYLMEQLNSLYAQAQIQGLSFALMIIDLDHFKVVNDTYGHQSGDAVLQTLGLLLKQAVRKSSLVARYGGEEFCILLPGLNATQAQVIAERIRQQIAQNIRVPGTSHQITCSIGLCDSHQSTSPNHLLGLADQALYQAKQRGRNQVVSYSPEVKEEANH